MFAEPRIISPQEELLDHIRSEHLTPIGITEGIFRFDIELAAAEGHLLDGLLPQLVALIEDPHPAAYNGYYVDLTRGQLPVRLNLNVDDYRTTLVKNLRYMEQLGVTSNGVDWSAIWSTVEKVIPNARNTQVNPDVDSDDLPY